jgi:hypothetical protein
MRLIRAELLQDNEALPHWSFLMMGLSEAIKKQSLGAIISLLCSRVKLAHMKMIFRWTFLATTPMLCVPQITDS